MKVVTWLLLVGLQLRLASQRSLVSQEPPSCSLRHQPRNEDGISNPTLRNAAVVKLVCMCHSSGALATRFKGSLSQLLDHTMIPFGYQALPKVDSDPDTKQVTSGKEPKMEVHIENCDKLRLKVDFPTALQLRSIAGQLSTSGDINLKITHSKRIHLVGIQLLPDRNHEIHLEDISGKVKLSGRVECPGCSHQLLSSASVTRLDSLPSLLSLEAVGIQDTMTLDRVIATCPMRVTLRESLALDVHRSRFELVPWPGFYMYNVSAVMIKENAFAHISPRSMVARSGQRLEIENNVLPVAQVLDVSQFSLVTIRCNRASEAERLPAHCPAPRGLTGLPFKVPGDSGYWHWVPVSICVAVFFSLWFIVMAAAFGALAAYKFAVGYNEPDELQFVRRGLRPPVGQQRQHLVTPGPTDCSVAPVVGQPQRVSFCTKTSSEERDIDTAKDEEEYSTSSRLHLAGGNCLLAAWDFPELEPTEPEALLALQHVSDAANPGSSQDRTRLPALCQ